MRSVEHKVEHKVEMYKLAQERRRQGKPSWQYTVRGFKDILNSDDDLIEKRDQVVALLRASSWFKRTEDASLSETLDELADVGHPDIDWDDDYSAERHFNDCLDQIYDLADWDRAWPA